MPKYHDYNLDPYIKFKKDYIQINTKEFLPKQKIKYNTKNCINQTQ